eukprot:165796_1
MLSSWIFFFMFLGVLYSWTYHNEQQQPCVVASSTPSTNDITPITVYAIDLSERAGSDQILHVASEGCAACCIKPHSILFTYTLTATDPPTTTYTIGPLDNSKSSNTQHLPPIALLSLVGSRKFNYYHQ